MFGSCLLTTKNFFTEFGAENSAFIKRIITSEEKWVHQYDVETVQQFTEWCSEKITSKSKCGFPFSLIAVEWLTLDLFHEIKRSKRNTTWPFLGIFVKQFFRGQQPDLWSENSWIQHENSPLY